MKIAPNLAALFATKPTGLEIPEYEPARTEYRALLASHHALKRLLTIGGCCRDVCGTTFDETCPTMARARKAIRRLERVSRGARRKP